MAEIISMSLDEEMLENLEELKKIYGFTGRSEVIRAGIRILINESKELKKLEGKIDASLLVVHPEKSTGSILKTMHRYQKFIKSQMHYHLEDHNCLELFIIKSDAKIVEEVIKNLRNEKGSVVKLTVL